MNNWNRLHGLILLFTFLFLLTYNSHAVSDQAGHTIEGVITNLPQGSYKSIYLYRYRDGKLAQSHSTPLNEQGGFELNIKYLQGGLYKIGVDPVNSAFIVVSDKESDMVIKSDFAELKADTVDVEGSIDNILENDAYRTMRKERARFAGRMGSLNSEKFQISTVDRRFTQKTGELDNKIRLLIRDHNSQLSLIKESYPDTFASEVMYNLSRLPQLSEHTEVKDEYDNERAFMHNFFFEFVDFADERIIHGPFLKDKYVAYLKGYTHHNLEGLKDSVDVILGEAKINEKVLRFTMQVLIDEFDQKGPAELVEYIVDNENVQGCNAPLSQSTAEKIKKIDRLRVGQPAPEVASNDAFGNPVALSSLSGKRAVMIYFWASWCGYCQTEIPDYVKVYNKFKEKGFEVYAVALETDKKKWLSAIVDNKLSWTNVSDLTGWKSESAETYNVRSTPTNFLLNSEGVIIAKKLNSRLLEEKLEEMMNKKQ